MRRSRVTWIMRPSAVRRSAVAAALLVGASLAPIVAAPPASALAPVGILDAMGANSYGELGNNSTTNALTPVGVKNLPNGVVAIAAGARHSLAILSDSSVMAWGRNDSGELGTNDTTDPIACPG